MSIEQGRLQTQVAEGQAGGTQAAAEVQAGIVDPTRDAYGEFQQAYDHFNRELFDGQLPNCLITLQRKANSMGYFSHQRFVRTDGTTTDEIALNPELQGGVTIIETLSTLAHAGAFVAIPLRHAWTAGIPQPGVGQEDGGHWPDALKHWGAWRDQGG